MLVLVVGAYVLRTVLVVILRSKAPRYVSLVERWWVWVWLPLAVILIAVTLWQPIVGLVVIGVTAVVVSRDDHIDLPWRDLDGRDRWRRWKAAYLPVRTTSTRLGTTRGTDSSGRPALYAGVAEVDGHCIRGSSATPADF